MKKVVFWAICAASYLSADIMTVQYAQAAQQAADTAATYDLPTQVVAEEKSAPMPQNPYITGADVSVITAQDIFAHHFSSIAQALKTVPGVIVQNPGYHGGEYGYNDYNTGVSINGENNITVLVNGVPVNSGISSRTGNAQGVDFSTLPNINDIAKIEVIKGTGSSIYGSSSAGGIISITTKKGGKKEKTSFSVAGGSWGHYKYSLTQSGTSSDKSLHYIFSVGQERSQDTRYKDPFDHSIRTYDNTRFENKMPISA